jgi:hypothetical protein
MMRSLITLTVASVLLAAVALAQDDPPAPASCWGQATQVFARMGAMGEHASSYDTPRLGLRNLARALHEQGVIEDDTLQALGAFVADELGLSVAACD